MSVMTHIHCDHPQCTDKTNVTQVPAGWQIATLQEKGENNTITSQVLHLCPEHRYSELK